MQQTNTPKKTTKVTSLRLPELMLKNVDTLAESRKWSRNQTITFLIEEQLKATPCQK